MVAASLPLQPSRFSFLFQFLLCLFVPVYDVISEIVIDACCGMETYQCIGIGKRQRERERHIKINFIAKFIVSLSIFYWTISPFCNLSHSFQLASTWFGHFMLSSCCVETFLALWCCHKSRRFPPCLYPQYCIFTATTRVTSLFFIIFLLLCQICQAFWWGESFANTRKRKYFVRLAECRNC